MNAVNRVVNVARLDLTDIHSEAGVISKEQFEEALAAARDFAQLRLNVEISEIELSEAALILEGMFNVFVGNEHVLANNENHIEWLGQASTDLDWRYWERYRQWLVEDEHRPPAVVDGSLGPITDHVLGLLEDPSRPGAWDRRGLVAGQVQSGKTSNYVGLINKAIDAGYKFIVVLAGTHDNLRSQTQSRINTGVLGFDSEGNINGSQGKRVGVGLKDGRKPRINCPTSSAQKGDFNRGLAKGVGALGGDPTILVVKKNTSILRNLYAWATGMHHEIDPMTGRKIVRGVPMLVIDDEADYASIDTGSVKDKFTGDESDPSATNKLIRQLLDAFEKSAYVGYTATPFANIFINAYADHDTFGPDLFPKHFIVTLPETSAYSGAARIFGLVEDQGAGIEAVEAIPTTREVSDYAVWLPDGHKKGQLPRGSLPGSLVTAVRSFILASALKRARHSHEKHNSMLVHVTRFVDVQAAVAQQIQDQIEAIRNQLSYLARSEEAASEWSELETLYLSDFVPVAQAMAQMPDLEGELGEMPEFGDLEELIEGVVAAITVKVINGEAKDSLQYDESPDGLTVIAIGGDKLSRGLTLAGLTTSYYLRASKMYDTLMQMGRWFGFRPGYLDTCRLFTTGQLVRWYARITSASERLYREFELMAALGRTPEDFGLRIQTHPDGLMVTAANKSRYGKNIRASFSGAISETILFVDDPDSRQRNLKALNALYSAIQASPEPMERDEHDFYWRMVPPGIVLNFLDGYEPHRSAQRALPKAMAEYIRACLSLESPELSSWDVLIASKSDSTDTLVLPDGKSVGLVVRNPDIADDAYSGRYVIGRLVSSGDELLPLTGDSNAWSIALEQAIDNWRGSERSNKGVAPTRPTAVAERKVRDPSRGFLLVYPLDRAASELKEPMADPYVGFAIAFPWSEDAPTVDYKVNDIYWDLEIEAAFREMRDND